jgi:hypothetical protein
MTVNLSTKKKNEMRGFVLGESECGLDPRALGDEFG